jgi:D-tyrosyl-tRNA(Tyr) deacylase
VYKGRRLGVERAEAPQRAKTLYHCLCDALRAHELVVETGRFGARMELQQVNDGPVTLLVFSRDGAIVPVV